MRRFLFVAAILSLTLAGCGSFQEGEDGTTPIGEAMATASQTYKDVNAAAKGIPIPGLSTELVGVIAGAAAALASGITVLVRRAGEKKKAKKSNAVGQPEATAAK
jgi:hypothetical protein